MTAQPQSTIEPPAQAPSPSLMDREQFKEWLGVSEWWVIRYTSRTEDPLPWIGTARARRIYEPDAIAWLRRNNGVTE